MKPKLLIVDDDQLLREVIGDFLSSHGYEVDLAENADNALEKFEPGKYQLALIDYMMPGMNGLELMKSLMQQDPKIFCLIMTGYPTVDSAFQSVVDGASDYIVKPFQLKELLNTICSYI
ncbi:MAG TPA: response regulator [Candidatus Cloacimonas sp.]|jgi:DNA-binding NtrC family response regulator|nr:response regulator [Candidatus Cloacimonas sp.]HNQ39853.1 response regulator [Candidatus Cloacimonas sp.]HNS84772.1 response regulator [Candidatus Cloacimonas sp.]HPA24205.1 response regulator [Candidatus Cloacimonas sp.]HPH93409.1 response regulator [Candidatus Cloacimonas sp.]